MKKIAILFGLVLSLISLNQNALAGLDIEPYVGYEMNKSTLDLVSAASGSDINETNNGVGLGFRLGYSFLVASVGIDYYTSKLKASAFDLTISEYGLYGGISLGIIRAWAVYLLNSKVDTEILSTEYKFEGKAFKVGVGFQPIPLVPLSLNLEVVSRTMDKINDVSFPSGTEAKFISYIFSVSAPI